MKTSHVTVFLLLSLLAVSARADETLTIRLVEASNDEKAGGAGLEDVVGALRENLSYRSYSLVASTTIPLPAKSAGRSLGKFTVTCSGSSSSLSVSVRKGRTELLQTTVVLQQRTPLVLGGLPGDKGKMVMVFITR